MFIMALLNLGMSFFEKIAEQPFQKNSYLKSATPLSSLCSEPKQLTESIAHKQWIKYK
jgi:hypothetical protein